MPSVLVTGASKGIGRATAAEFARRGYRVVATARDPRTLDDLDLGDDGSRLALDVTDQASVDTAVAAAGDVDVLVSNAGVIFAAAVEAMPPAELERIFAANTSGAVRIAQALLPRMRERGSGRLLFVSSTVGRVVFPGRAAYAATKWALEAIVEALAMEVRDSGIEAALLEPGPVSTGATDDMLTYTVPGDPYAALLARGGRPRTAQTAEEVATAFADAAALETLPLRIPVGEWSTETLKRRDVAPYDVPFDVAG